MTGKQDMINAWIWVILVWSALIRFYYLLGSNVAVWLKAILGFACGLIFVNAVLQLRREYEEKQHGN